MNRLREMQRMLSDLLGLLDQTPTDAAARVLAVAGDIPRSPATVAPSALASGLARGDDAPPTALRFLGPVSEQGNMIDRAIDLGLIATESPALAFYREVRAKLGHAVNVTGVDVRMAKARHPVKAWAMFSTVLTPADLSRYETLPEVARRHLPLFEELGYRGTNMIAFDPQGTINVYFYGRRPFLRRASSLSAVAERLGFEAPPDQVAQLSAHGLGIYPTFDFDPTSRTPIRLTIARGATPADTADLSPALRPYCTWAEQHTGPLVSLALGCTLHPDPAAFTIKADVQMPGMGALECMGRGMAGYFTPLESLGALRHLTQRYPVAFPLTVLAQLPGAGPLAKRVARRLAGHRR